MKAGFARVPITPPIGTPMIGFARRDRAGGCTGVHDPLYASLVYLSHAGAEVLIGSFDLCFLARDDTDRLVPAIGRALGLEPHQILLATTHTHAGPATGTWAYAEDLPPRDAYLAQLEAATVRAATEARAAAREATLWAARGHTMVPMSRRRKGPDGKVTFGPSPDGTICDSLPVVMLKDGAGRPITLMFSISCHPSTAGGFEVSSDFPGVARAAIEEHLGAEVSMFVQGAGGDAKVAASAAGSRWKGNDWNVVDTAGRTLAREVIGVLEAGLAPVEPALASALVEVPLGLAEPASRDELQAVADKNPDDGPTSYEDVRIRWARRLLAQLDAGDTPPDSVSLRVQGMQLGRDLRLVAIEGEAVGELGLHIERQFDRGITIPVGYANGQGLYLPVAHMLAEGGYEVESYWEYGVPAPLAEGAEAAIDLAMPALRDHGIR